MQEAIIRIQPKGVITIPIRLRKALGLTANNLARIREIKGRLIIEPVTTLPYPVRNYTEKEIEEFIAYDTKETKALKKKKII